MSRAFLVSAKGWRPVTYETIIPLTHGTAEADSGFFEVIAPKIAIATIDDVLALNGSQAANTMSVVAWLSVLPRVTCIFFNADTLKFEPLIIDRVDTRRLIESTKDKMERERDEQSL